MKSNFLVLFAMLPFASVAQQQYEITGTVKNVKLPARAYLVYQQNGKMYRDSAEVTGETFLFTGNIPAPTKAFVLLAQNGKMMTKNSTPTTNQLGVYLEKGNISINALDSLPDAVVSGTPLNNDQMELTTVMKGIKKTEIQMDVDFKKANGDAAKQDQIKAAFDQLQAFKIEMQKKFIETHKNSLVALNLLRASINPATDLETAKQLFASLAPDLRSTGAGQSYERLMGQASAINVGGQAPDFSLKNTKGQEISLASFKGKYVLVDFWASWCGPCRQENPNVVKAYDKYKSKNFAILGVSLDGGNQAKEKWLEAIAKDKLSWEQVSDLQGWQSEVVRSYQLNAIPANFLIDPAGKIIAKNLRGTDLEAKLAQILL